MRTFKPLGAQTIRTSGKRLISPVSLIENEAANKQPDFASLNIVTGYKAFSNMLSSCAETIANFAYKPLPLSQCLPNDASIPFIVKRQTSRRESTSDIWTPSKMAPM